MDFFQQNDHYKSNLSGLFSLTVLGLLYKLKPLILEFFTSCVSINRLGVYMDFKVCYLGPVKCLHKKRQQRKEGGGGEGEKEMCKGGVVREV